MRARLSQKLGLWLAFMASIVQAYTQIDVEHVISIGRNALHFNDYVVSIGYFNQAIDARPWLALPYYYRAVAKINLEDYSGAAADASLCLERNPFISKAYLVRGIARQNLRQRQDAIADYTRGLELVPNDLGMGLNLALAYSQEKAYREAEEVLSSLLHYTPKNTEAHHLGASIALERGDTVLAMQRINEALALDSTQAMPYKLRSHIYASQEHYPASLQDLNRAIELEPGEAGLLTNRGILHYRINKLRQAMDDYSNALKLEPKNRVARYNRALLRTLVGEQDAALSDWNEVLRLEPNNHIARYNRAILAQKVGRWQDALRDLDIVLSEYPSFIDGFWLRSQLRKALNDHKGAERDYWHAWDLQQNKRYRNSAHTQAIKNHNRSTRTVQDTEIDKYAMLIEERVDLSNYKPKYSSMARGRVQDRDTQVVPCPPFYLTYFSQLATESKPYVTAQHTEKLLEEESNLSNLNHRLKLYSEPYPLSKEEIQALETIIRKDIPDSTDQAKRAYLHRGIAYTLLQDYDFSIELLNKAIALDGQYRLAYLARSIALMRKHDIEQQNNEPTSTISIRPNGTITAISHEISAKKDLDTLIRFTPKFAHAYYNRALLHTQLGDASAALSDYTSALKLSPRMAEAYFNRGLLLLSQGKKDEGIADLSQAGELGLYQAYNIMKRISRD